MKKISILIALCLFVFITVANSQEEAVKGKKQGDIPLYGLLVTYKAGTFFTQKVVEITNVHRIYPDETVKDYSREITYYITTKVPSSPDDGFQTLLVTVDSLVYKFKEGESVFEFNTTDMVGNALTFKDLNYKTVSLGREFELVYSPYGEVADIKSDEISETINYVNEKGEGYLTDVQKYFWINGLSKEHLGYLSDIKKILLPEEKIAVDSIWYSPVSLELNGYNFYDTLALKITNYNAGTYTLEGESLSIKPYDKESFTYNVSDLVKVSGVTGKGKFKVMLKAMGRVESTESEYDVNAKIKVGEQFIVEQIKSNVKWQFLNLFKL